MGFFSQTVREYYALAKPGIIYGNLINAVGAFFFASRGDVDWPRFFAAMLGSSLVVASGCVFNNYIDRDIDALMGRTKVRAMVKGAISVAAALSYGAVLGLVGFALLAAFTNLLTVCIGIAGFLGYVVVYGYSKRVSVYGTLIGSLAGSVPPLAGYTAASGVLDAGAILLFLIVAIWQMPHFYGIAMYRLKEYEAASIPVLPAVKGMLATRIHILSWITVFILVAPLLAVFAGAGYAYAVIIAIFGLEWLRRGISTFKTAGDIPWGRGVFRFSLVVILALSVLLSLDFILP